MGQTLPKFFLNIRSYSSHKDALSLTIPMRTRSLERCSKLPSLHSQKRQNLVDTKQSLSRAHRTKLHGVTIQ